MQKSQSRLVLLPALSVLPVLLVLSTCSFSVLWAQGGSPAQNAVSRVADSNPIHQQQKSLLPTVVAEVNGQKITADDLRAETLRVHGAEVLERIENRYLVLAECKRRQVTITRDEVNQEIERLAKANHLSVEQFTNLIQEQNGMSPKQYADEVIWPRLALQALVAPEIEISDEELEREYLKNYGPSVVIQQIMTKSKDEADGIRARVLADPDSFGDVAKNESTDMLTASNKGRMQPIRRYAFADPQLEDLFFSMNPGDISEVIGPYGPEGDYIIFKCENRYDSIVPQEKIDEIKGILRSRAADEKLKAAANALFEKLGREADVVNVLGNPELTQKYPGAAALVSGHPISLESVTDKSLELYAKQDLEGLILFTLLRQELKKLNVTLTEEDLDTEIWIKAAETTYPLPDGKPNIEAYMKRELEATHFSEKVYRTNIVWPAVAIRKLSEPLVKITDEDLQKSYEANFGERVQCLAIYVQDQRLAQEAWQKARTLPAKENRSLEEVFGDLAAKYSAEPGSRQMRGRIAPIAKNGGFPTLEEEAFSLKPGELSGVIQIDRNSFVILYCQEILPAQDVSFEDAKETITTSVRQKNEFLAARQYLADLYKRSTVNNFLTGQKAVPQTGAPPAPNPFQGENVPAAGVPRES